VSGDLSIKAVPGPRPPGFRLTSAYTGRLYRAARYDAVVARAFLRVAHLIDPPTRILRPGIALRVLRAAGRADHGPSPER
jgi:hypothetical protein